MTLYLNNCQAFDHADWYGGDAFYDLGTLPPHAVMAPHVQPGVRPGEECIVAIPLNDQGEPQRGGQTIEFRHYRLETVTIQLSPPGLQYPNRPFRVFRGPLLRSVRLPKDQAATTTTPPYCRFFDSRGYFKRQSVV